MCFEHVFIPVIYSFLSYKAKPVFFPVGLMAIWCLTCKEILPNEEMVIVKLKAAAYLVSILMSCL
jgi:hypothetical protein